MVRYGLLHIPSGKLVQNFSGKDWLFGTHKVILQLSEPDCPVNIATYACWLAAHNADIDWHNIVLQEFEIIEVIE